MSLAPSNSPFAEPPWLNGMPSPYFSDNHRAWQKACRKFIDEHMNQYLMDWERDGEMPPETFNTFAKAGMLLPNLSCPLPVEQLAKLGIHDVLGVVKIKDFDYLHTYIYWDEMVRYGLIGAPGQMTTGISFAVPPLYKFGSPALQAKWLPDFLLGKKKTCIAITEPSAGSDVANIQTTAVKSQDGKHYIVNGNKKWISTAIWADYCTCAVRTGGAGPSGLSLLIIPLKDAEGVTMRRFRVTGQYLTGTTYIEFDNVKVPVENLIGEEGMGMKYIMTNFNHERLQISVQVCRSSRVALACAFDYVLKREAFGKKLIDQPVVRHRLAKCGAELESFQAWIEAFCYQMTKLSKADADRELGGLTAMAKAQAGRVFDECARTAVLLFGGNGLTQSGQGELVEKLYREVPGARIPGGSEDVMFDLSIREMIKNFKRKSQAAKM